jgi:hypothetical protein
MLIIIYYLCQFLIVYIYLSILWVFFKCKCVSDSMILIVRVRVTHFNLHQHTFLGTQNLVVNVMKASNHSIRVFDIKLDFKSKC